MIDQSFGDELNSAGLGGLPFSWGEDGSVTYGDTLTQQQHDDIAALVAAHNGDLARAKRLKADLIKAESQALISAIFGASADTWDLVYREINRVSAVLDLTQKLADGEVLTGPEEAVITAARAEWVEVKAIRMVENTTTAAVIAATTVQGVADVVVAWP